MRPSSLIASNGPSFALVHCLRPAKRGRTADQRQKYVARPLACADTGCRDLGLSSRRPPARALIGKVYYGSHMLQELIHNARRRLLFNEVLKQFALSAALAMAAWRCC